MSADRQTAGDIAAAYNALNADPDEQPAACPTCGGDGWYVGHEDACHDSGDCVCSGEQVQCECQEAVAT